MRPLAVVLFLLPLLAGCISTSGPLLEASGAHPQGLSRVVVALVDSGINPYHVAFRGNALGPVVDSLIDATSGEPPTKVRLTLGENYFENVEADRDFWTTVQPRRLYAFEGTNVLAISFRESGRIVDQNLTIHGSEVASAIARANPDAIILMIEAYSSITASDTYGQEAEGIGWLIRQPWVDVISFSFASRVHEAPGFDLIPGQTRVATGDGKVVVAGAGNAPVGVWTNDVAGPPWVISVGGVVDEDKGEGLIATKTPDVVSAFQGVGASNNHTTAYRSFGGTSLAAPTVAGEISTAILELRQRHGHEGGIRNGALVQWAGGEIRNTHVRHALNFTATYWNLTDYRGQNLSEHPVEMLVFASMPILPAPWLQMGWGYAGESLGLRLASVLDGFPAPEKPEAARAYMNQMQALREAYWATR